jgi:hypothetical protein
LFSGQLSRPARQESFPHSIAPHLQYASLSIEAGSGMEQLYKRHRIEVLTDLDGSGWNVSLRIFCKKGGAHALVMFALTKEFATYDGAIKAGITAARSWINASELRNLSNTTTLCAYSKRLCEKSRVLRQIARTTMAASGTIVDQSSALYSKLRSPALTLPVERTLGGEGAAIA